jgi:catalase
LAGIGVLILGISGSFLYLGGWFSPHALTPARFVDAFEQVYGIHPGFRRNHAKGVCVSGFFESNDQGTRLSKAVVFRTGRVSVIGRFSFGGGDPYVADAPDLIRGLGLLFWLPDGEEWRTAMINLPVFPVRTPQGFFDNLFASQPDPQTHKQMEAFPARHPEAVQAMKIIKSRSVSSGFENSTYNSLNAFRFVDAGGASIPVRWSMVPVQQFVAANPTAADQGNKNYLFNALITAILQHPLQWHLVITVGQPGDVTDDATISWPDGREQVDVGTLTLDSVESEETSPARDINFDPLVLPAGMAPSDDPLLSARSAVYSRSFTRRAGETKKPSAITPSEVRRK